MEARRLELQDIFRKYTRLPRDKSCFIIDVRPQSAFKRHHLLLSYCVRLTADGKALVDYSKNLYDQRWSQHIWWNSDVIVIGEEGLKKSHDVIQFLLTEARVASLGYFRDGVTAFEKQYPFLVGQSVKAHRGLVYPSPLRGCKGLYLGNWQSAEDSEKLKQLGITRLVSIHNDPQNLKFPASVKQMAITAADLPSTNLTPYFDATYVFIEDSLAASRGVLVHCGAGSSRSAAICAAYLMRKQRIGAASAVRALLGVRSSVCPNEGFWRQLCAFETELGVPPAQRSDVKRPPVVNESYGQVAADEVAQQAAGAKVQVDVQREAGGKRQRSPVEETVADSASDGRRTAARPSEQNNGHRSSLRATLEVEISKDGRAAGTLTIPELRPYQRCVFGRGPDADVKLQHASLSRAHAELAVDRDGVVTLCDLGSAHGTNVDGAWVKANSQKEVRVGTKFRFAASSRTYRVLALDVHR